MTTDSATDSLKCSWIRTIITTCAILQAAVKANSQMRLNFYLPMTPKSLNRLRVYLEYITMSREHIYTSMWRCENVGALSKHVILFGFLVDPIFLKILSKEAIAFTSHCSMVALLTLL